MSAIPVERTRQDGPPQTIVWAVIITVVVNIASYAVFLLPGSDDIPAGAIVIGSVASLLTIVPCYWLWKCKKWAAIVVTVVSVLNMLSSIPGLFDPPSAAIATAIIVGIPLTLIPVWLIWHPDSREAYQR